MYRIKEAFARLEGPTSCRPLNYGASHVI